MRRFPVFLNILAFVVIASLLSLPLASDPVFTSFENTISEVSISVNDDGTTKECSLKKNPELSFNADLTPAEERPLYDDRLQLAKPAMTVLPLKEILSEIFIPPKILS